MTFVPAIARRRHKVAIENFTRKVEALESILSQGNLDRFPKRGSISSFAGWSDNELSVAALSRAVIYDKSDEYLRLSERMKVALVRLNAMRSKRRRKENSEDLLLGRAERAEACAKTYVNQYSIAMAELAELKKENERLRHKLARLESSRAKITPLHLIKNKASSSD